MTPRKISAVQELHDDVRQRETFVGARVQRPHDVFARDGARRLGLARETDERGVVFRGEPARDHLGRESLAVEIFDLVDRAHAATSDDTHDTEASAEPLPDETELVRVAHLQLWNGRWIRIEIGARSGSPAQRGRDRRHTGLGQELVAASEGSERIREVFEARVATRGIRVTPGARKARSPDTQSARS
jgi:hypothetical protein